MSSWLRTMDWLCRVPLGVFCGDHNVWLGLGNRGTRRDVHNDDLILASPRFPWGSELLVFHAVKLSLFCCQTLVSGFLLNVTGAHKPR